MKICDDHNSCFEEVYKRLVSKWAFYIIGALFCGFAYYIAQDLKTDIREIRDYVRVIAIERAISSKDIALNE